MIGMYDPSRRVKQLTGHVQTRGVFLILACVLCG
jgi:hypothetical protein